jgi:hypothetical protein
MTSAKFFARGGDRTNIFQTSFDSCTYEWNGYEVNNSLNPQTLTDGSLALQVLLSPPLTIPVDYIGAKITQDGRSDTSRRTFNGAYKTHLGRYISDDECPITAKSWLVEIYEQIDVPQ